MRLYKYIEEIEELKKTHNLSSGDVLMLHILAIVETSELDYNKFKKEILIKESKK